MSIVEGRTGQKDQQHILILIQCPDKIGLVAAISDIIAEHQLNITVMREFVDKVTDMFFARIECNGEISNLEFLDEKFKNKLGADAFIRVYPHKHQKKIAILVSKEYHCLGDILVKYFFGQLNAEICCVIGNHPDLESFTRRFDIPFFCVAHEQKSKQQFEQEILNILVTYNPDYVFLAKFMRILSDNFITHYPDRIVNIHHSFLPAFIGASPYRQAFERGVKIIGATAHIVTEELDNGPIIVQETIHVNHNFSTPEMKLAGREIERSVLGKAMRLILEDRVFVIGNKTVIFE